MFGSLAGFFTNPWTIGIGAGILAGIGLWKLFSESPEDKMRKKIQAVYGVTIRDKGVMKQLVQIAKQGFGGNIDMAVRSAQVRDMVELYAQTTGQQMRGATQRMTSSTLVQSSAGLYEAASYSNGTLVSGGNVGASLDSLGATSMSSGVFRIELSAPQTKQFLETGFVSTITKNARNVAAASLTAAKSNFNRRELAATQFAPGTLTS
jgi:hypothetical protein